MKSKISEYLKKIINNRALSLTILLIIFLFLCFYYYGNFMEHQEYPTVTQDLFNYTVGETISFSITVEKTYPGGFYLYYGRYQGKNIYYKVNSSQEVDTGDKVYFLGIMEPANQIISTKMIIIKKWSYYSLILRSLVAFVILILIFNKYWYFNHEKREFRRRK
jgi:hypothetical protein